MRAAQTPDEGGSERIREAARGVEKQARERGGGQSDGEPPRRRLRQNG
jgi:hypothetical protein